MHEEQINRFLAELSGKSAQEVIEYFGREFKGEIALSSSLSYEDQAITHMIASSPEARDAYRVFTLDTGRLFPETYQLIDRTNMTYGINVEVFFPDYKEVQRMVREEGINLFYNSIESRHRCCQIRKLEPLGRAFKGLKAWVCGLRRGQSLTRKDMQLVEWDEKNGLFKINPLIDWSEEEVVSFVKKNGVPYNVLHDKGFPSIGCQPCTRAVKPGEDVRAGRWWWESPEHRECGLHVK